MIDYISANNGNIQLWNGNQIVAEACTAKSIVYFLQENGFNEDGVYASSSMDFASEEGFKNDEDATILWDKGHTMYLDEVEAVGSKWDIN